MRECLATASRHRAHAKFGGKRADNRLVSLAETLTHNSPRRSAGVLCAREAAVNVYAEAGGGRGQSSQTIDPTQSPVLSRGQNATRLKGNQQMAGKPGRSAAPIRRAAAHVLAPAGRRSRPSCSTWARMTSPMRAFLLALHGNRQVRPAGVRLRLDAAKALMRYAVRGQRKKQAADAAKNAAAGRFPPASKPPLKIVRP